MRKSPIPVLYLFENVFFPDTVIPMVLSDEPSKNLVTEAFQSDLAVALYSTHPRSKGVATVGKILMLDMKDDGRLVAIIQGTERVLLTNVIQHLPYPIYECEPFQDLKETHAFSNDIIERLFKVFESWIFRHVHSKDERDIFLRDVNSPKKLTFNISLFMIKDIELKILFLESRSVADRINMLQVLLAGELPESEDKEMAEAIKNFERLEPLEYKNVAN